MSLVEVVRTPSGEEFCVEAYSAHSLGGRLRRVEEPPGEWQVDVFRWPVSLRRTGNWSTVVPFKREAEQWIQRLIALLESGAWVPADGEPTM